MCMKEIALREYDELKAERDELISSVMNLETCIKQIKLDLLNSLKTEFINSNQSCESILESRIVNLELDND